MPYNFTGKAPCVLAGCLLVEEMLTFGYHRPTRLAASLAALPAPEMYVWARNQMLHRVLETALQSTSVPAERKLHIFASLQVRPPADRNYGPTHKHRMYLNQTVGRCLKRMVLLS